MRGFPQRYVGPGPTLRTMRGTDDPIATSGPFGGCTNDVQLSVYMGKLSLNWALRGFVSGVALGAVGAVVGLYFIKR